MNDYPEINKKYFPGHWVYETGSLLSEDCTSSQTHIQVKAIDYFREKAYVYRNTSPRRWIPHYVLLVELDEQGNKLWYNSEIAHIKSIDSSTSTLILNVERQIHKAVLSKPERHTWPPLQEESGETMSCFTITYHQPAQKIRTAEQPPTFF